MDDKAARQFRQQIMFNTEGMWLSQVTYRDELLRIDRRSARSAVPNPNCESNHEVFHPQQSPDERPDGPRKRKDYVQEKRFGNIDSLDRTNEENLVDPFEACLEARGGECRLLRTWLVRYDGT